MVKTSESVTRYVITHVAGNGQRRLTFAQQGRRTFATAQAAEVFLRTFREINTPERLASIYGKQAVGTFTVRAVECWPGHYDPKSYWFDNEEGQ